jgi:hypothetical protein
MKKSVDEDFIWFVGSPKELEEYKGKHVAIWKREVIGFGDSAKEAYDKAKRKYPVSNPTLTFIPEEEELILRL